MSYRDKSRPEWMRWVVGTLSILAIPLATALIVMWSDVQHGNAQQIAQEKINASAANDRRDLSKEIRRLRSAIDRLSGSIEAVGLRPPMSIARDEE